MFDIGWSELVVIGVVALIVIGPKELPGVLRMMGQWIGKVRRMAADFQGQFQEAMREAEMADLKKQVDEFADSTRDLTKDFDPLGDMQDAIDDPFGEKAKPAETGASKVPPGAVAVPNAPPAEGAAEPAPVAQASAEVTPLRSAETQPADDAPPPKAATGGHSA